MILSTLVTSQLHFEMCAGLYGHPVVYSLSLQFMGKWCKKQFFCNNIFQNEGKIFL